MLTKKSSSFLSVGILVLLLLVFSSIVPNSFSVSLAGAVLSGLLFLLQTPQSFLDQTLKKIFQQRVFWWVLCAWLFLIVFAGCLNAWARFVSPGYDLYWFTQAISMAKSTSILKTSSERFYTSILVQHWEPILYTGILTTFIAKSSIASMLWQGLGFIGGTWGAAKLSSVLFAKTKYPQLQYVATLFYAWSFANINPLSFDVHPPVFGGLLFIPWIVYFFLKGKNPILLILLLAQCGEIFMPVAGTYLAYFFVQKSNALWRWLVAVVFLFGGYLVLSFYQKYLGPWWSGLPYNYADRYGNIGGDGFGIIYNFLHHPFHVLSQLFEKEKIKTFLKIICYSGPFFAFAFIPKYSRKLVVFIALGCVPYILQVGLSSYNLLYATNTHYLGALGSQWWCLSVFGIVAFLKESCFAKLRNWVLKSSVGALICVFFFLNSSEWRKSPLYPIRGIFERDMPAQNVRDYLTNLPKKEGVLFVSTEWLCPLAAYGRPWEVCMDGSGYFDKMPLDVVVSRNQALPDFYNHLSATQKSSFNGQLLKELVQMEVSGEHSSAHWTYVLTSQQKPYKEKPIFFSIFARKVSSDTQQGVRQQKSSTNDFQ